jgi:hypothetical protein
MATLRKTSSFRITRSSRISRGTSAISAARNDIDHRLGRGGCADRRRRSPARRVALHEACHPSAGIDEVDRCLAGGRRVSERLVDYRQPEREAPEYSGVVERDIEPAEKLKHPPHYPSISRGFSRLATAKAIDLDIPPILLALADEVIE